MKRIAPVAGLAITGLAVLSLVAASTPMTGIQPVPIAEANDFVVSQQFESTPTQSPWWPAPTTYITNPTPAATATWAPAKKPAPTKKPAPAPYRDTVWNARAYVKAQIGAAQYHCISVVWWHESKWNPRAANPSGAYGIPQAKPGNKMQAFGSNWRYSPLTQVKWGMWYVKDRYGSACGALAFWDSQGWY